MKKEFMLLLSLFSIVVPTMYGASKTMDVVEVEGIEIDPEEVKAALIEVAEEHPQLKVVAQEAKKRLVRGIGKHAIKQRLKEICDKMHEMSFKDRKAMFEKFAHRFPGLAHKLQRLAKKHGKPILTEEEEVTILPVDIEE